jgi:hypothetical protein
MKLRSVLSAALLLTGFCSVSAFADPLVTITGTITTANATELGRPSRNGVPQQWNNVESYPGVNPSTTVLTYYYQTYTISNSLFNPNNYLDISFTDQLQNGLLFVSAYSGSYNPNARDQNWLGDLGYQSNAYGPDALFFDVVATAGQDLVLVVTTTGGGTSGTNNPYEIDISGFTNSSDYLTAPVTPYVAPTPEPSTFVELGTAVVAFAGMARRRFLKA